MIIDSHAHLNDERLYPKAEEIIAGFKDNNIESCIIAGFSYKSSVLGVELAEKYNQYAIIGTHPEEVTEVTKVTLDKYKELAKNNKVVGIGEIGLDYYYEDNPPKDQQIQAFEAQIELADEVNLPIALHVRDAYGDCLDVLQNMHSKLNNGVLLHCYSSSVEMIERFLKFDCYFALGGAITFKNAKKDDVIKAIPKDRLLVETDCPYLTPHPHRGETNEPKFINLTIDKISDVLAVAREEIIDITNRNTKRLFTKIQ